MSVPAGRVASVILAAGFSSRMGAFKPLLDLGGRLVLERCIRTFREAGVERILAVTGHRADEVEAVALGSGAGVIRNPMYAQGMFSSVCAGISALPDVEAFFLLPVDIPLVRPATVGELLRHYDGRVTYPCFAGEPGHPPLIPAGLIPAIAEHDGQGGLKALLETRRCLDVPVWDRGVLLDADTPEQFSALEGRAERLDIGERDEALALAGMSMPERGVAHGTAVAQVAVRLGLELNAKGETLDLDLLHNAGLLHDIAKGQPRHEARGAEILASLGLSRLSDIVAAHRDVPPPESGRLAEKELVCLADKLVRCSTRVGVRERFGEKLAIYADDAEACEGIRGRMGNALVLQGMVEKAAGRGIEDILGGEQA